MFLLVPVSEELIQAAIDRNLTQKIGDTPGVIRSLELDLVPPDQKGKEMKVSDILRTGFQCMARKAPAQIAEKNGACKQRVC